MESVGSVRLGRCVVVLNAVCMGSWGGEGEGVPRLEGTGISQLPWVIWGCPQSGDLTVQTLL